jgi:hypothetical protein
LGTVQSIKALHNQSRGRPNSTKWRRDLNKSHFAGSKDTGNITFDQGDELQTEATFDEIEHRESEFNSAPRSKRPMTSGMGGERIKSAAASFIFKKWGYDTT